ncbi:MAG: ATPase, T2SS/T4P/T4SS family [Candidatus Ozemobacteraceae bacterium]
MAKLLPATQIRRPLATILKERGFIRSALIRELVKRAEDEGVAFEELLSRERTLPEDKLYAAIAESFGLPFTDLAEYKKIQTLGAPAAEICVRARVVPLALVDGVLSVAIAKPAELKQFEDQLSGVGYPVRFYVAPPTALNARLQGIVLEVPLDDFFSGISGVSGINELAMSIESVEETSTNRRAIDLSDGADLPSIIQMVNKTLILGVRQRASDIHVESVEKGVRVRFRVDGVLADRFELTSAAANAFISRIMVIAALDITEKMMPQDGSFKGVFEGNEIEFRIASMPGLYGQNITLRILAGGGGKAVGLTGLGLRQDEIDTMRRQIGYPHGMILVSGPTGSGKSTTLYALIETLTSPTVKIITIEDPVERRLDRVQQIQVRINRNDAARSITFARGLRSILRLDPDVIMVGEIRDSETAEIAVQASLTGHLVLSTVHANSALETLRRMHNIGVDPFLMLASLNMVVAQRLVRRLCAACRRPRPLTPEEAKLFSAENLPGQVFEHAGCSQCLGTGYQGRIGIFEMLPIEEEFRSGNFAANPGELSGAARRYITCDLLKSGLFRLAAGETDFAELERVMGPCR